MGDTTQTTKEPEFLEGRFHSLILNHFDQSVLAAVIASVKAAADYPPFVAKRNTINAARVVLEGIPLDPALAGLPDHPDTEKGFRNYGNAGGYKTIVRSDTMTLTVERDRGFLMANEGGEKWPFTLPGHASDVVALRDHFYLVVSRLYW